MPLLIFFSPLFHPGMLSITAAMKSLSLRGAFFAVHSLKTAIHSLPLDKHFRFALY